MRQRSIAVLLLLFLTAFAWPVAAQDTAKEAIVRELARGLEGDPTRLHEAHLNQLHEFYQARDFAPLWINGQSISAKGATLVEVLNTADEDGLNPDHYDAEALAAKVASPQPAELATLEVDLSLAMMHYVSDLASGRVIPKEADPKLDIYPRDIDLPDALRGAAASDDIAAFLDQYVPPQPEYDRLKAAFADYRKLAAGGGWPAFPEGETLKPGMTNARVAALREQMRVRGDLLAENDSAEKGGDAELYDPALQQALERFQERHGLTPDGVVGPATAAELNVSVKDRLRTMLLNMERRRWMADKLNHRYVFVNLADFRVKYVENGNTLYDSLVQVGSRYTQSPVFDDKIEYMVLNPHWHVPPSIAGRVILPKLQKDPNYLTENNFVLLSDWTENASQLDPSSIDWSKHDRQSIKRFKLRQGPGARNALGRIKIMFPNEHSVYMHDTPSKSLFAKTERTTSSGCIRVEKPFDLALFLLGQDSGWSMEKMQALIDSDETQVVRLDQPVEVHLTYLTSWVNKDGTVYFRPDVYERDKRLAKALLDMRDEERLSATMQ